MLLAALCSACGASSPQADEPRPVHCRGALEHVDTRLPVSWAEWPEGAVAAVAVRGARTVPEELVREVIDLAVGRPIDVAVVREDIRDILALEVFEDVRVHADRAAGGVRVTYEVMERPLVREVRLVGVGRGVTTDRLEAVEGEVFNPQRLHRLALRFTADHRTEGYAEATARARARRVDDGSVDVCFVVDAGRRWVIGGFEIEGNEQLTDDDILERIETFGGRVNAVGGVYREDLLASDLAWVTATYYDRGMVEARLDDPRVEWDGGRLEVVIRVQEGPVFRLGRVTVRGDLNGPAPAYTRVLGLQTGEVFSRRRIAEGLERIRQRDAARDITVQPITDIDSARRVVDLTIEVTSYEAPAESEAGDSHLDVDLVDEELHIDNPPPQEAP